jgi:SanA protein
MWLFALLLTIVPVLSFFSVLVLANAWILLAARGCIVGSPADAPNAHAILILGAPVPNEQNPGPIMEDRLQCGLRLFQLKKAPRIIISGRSDPGSHRETVVMENWLLAHGVPPESLAIDGHAFRTIDSVHNLVAFRAPPQHVLVCTQNFHLPRAVFLLKQKGFMVTGIVADSHVYRDKTRFALRESLGRLRALYETLVHIKPACSHLTETNNRLSCSEKKE